jgi:hypothetical protein
MPIKNGITNTKRGKQTLDFSWALLSYTGVSKILLNITWRKWVFSKKISQLLLKIFI